MNIPTVVSEVQSHLKRNREDFVEELCKKYELIGDGLWLLGDTTGILMNHSTERNKRMRGFWWGNLKQKDFFQTIFFQTVPIHY